MALPGQSLAPRWVAVLIDVTLALLAAAAGTWRELALHPDLLVPIPPPIGVLVQLAAAALLLVRRAHPLACGLGIAALSLLTPTYASFAVPFQAFAFSDDRRRGTGVALLAPLTWAVGAQAWLLADPYTFLLVHLISAVAGLLARSRVQLAGTLVDRAERAEREQHLLAERAVTAERIRLAGEMHDLVSHQITLMVLQAGALEVGPGIDSGIRAAAERLQASGRQALTELRGLVDVLRTPGEVDAQPVARSLADIDLDLDDGRSARPAVTDPFVVHTALRVVQEGLTNAGRHAPGQRIVVRVDQRTVDAGEQLLAVTVTNGRTPSADTGDPGRGLQVMRRRVELLGGRLSVHSDEQRHEIRVALPVPVPAEGLG